jgi:multisubunit Na+/H+ antiporter MnhE subunit
VREDSRRLRHGNTPPVIRHLAWWIGTWLALFWLWLLLAGDWNRIEWIAAACAAAAAATVGEIARSRARVELRIPLRWLARAWTVPVMILVDFGILLWALLGSLARRRVVRGRLRAHGFPSAEGPGVRAWAAYAANFSPNAYVVDIDPERNHALVHDLVPNRSSEKPA